MAALNKQHWTIAEIQWLVDNYQHLTDTQMVDYLHRSKTAILAKRAELHLRKTHYPSQGPRFNPPPNKDGSDTLKANPILDRVKYEKLVKYQKREMIHRDLLSSPIYQAISGTLTSEENEFYKQEHIRYVETYETFTPVEKEGLHVCIMSLIRMHKYQQVEKAHNDKNEADGQYFSLHREIKDQQEVFFKAQEQLNVSRKQRLEQEGDDKITIISLVRDLMSDKNRSALVVEANAINFLQNSESDKMRDNGNLFDANTDNVNDDEHDQTEL